MTALRRWILPSLLMATAILADKLFGGGVIWGWLGGGAAIMLHPDTAFVLDWLGERNG